MAMTEITARLDEFRLEIQYHLTVGAFADRDLDAVNDDGELPVVVALGEERLPVLFRRIEAVGGYATAFVKDTDGRVRRVTFINEAGAIDPASAEDMASDDRQPGAMATVGMFLDFLAVMNRPVRVPMHLRDEGAPVINQPELVNFA
jgi:hypothetical protein